MTRSITIGLTGSIGMGKSTTAEMFEKAGVPIWSADAAVHRLYGSGGKGVEALRSVFPTAIKNGTVDRDALSRIIAEDDSALRQIEALIHPLVMADRASFVDQTDAAVLVLDVPLLFEGGLDASVDYVVVVSTDEATQRDRVMARPGMTEEKFKMILSKQVPDQEKRRRADFVIETSSLEAARDDVHHVLNKIRGEAANA